MNSANSIKCRFCGWHTAKFSHGGIRKAYDRLVYHVESQHHDEYMKMDLAAALGHPETNPDELTVQEILDKWDREHPQKGSW